MRSTSFDEHVVTPSLCPKHMSSHVPIIIGKKLDASPTQKSLATPLGEFVMVGDWLDTLLERLANMNPG